jgi:hypothetical protein
MMIPMMNPGQDPHLHGHGHVNYSYYHHQEHPQMQGYTIKMNPHNIFSLSSSSHIPHPSDDVGDNLGFKYIQAPPNLFYSNPFGNMNSSRIKQEESNDDSEGENNGNKKVVGEKNPIAGRKKRGGIKNVSFRKESGDGGGEMAAPRRKNSKKRDGEGQEETAENHPLKQIKREIRKNSLEDNDHKYVNNKNVYLSKITNLMQSNNNNDVWKQYKDKKYFFQ